MIEYKKLNKEDVTLALFAGFERRQVVTKCWRQEEDGWKIREEPFVDDWNAENYAFLVQCLQDTAENGGLVLGAMEDGRLIGLAAAAPGKIGSRGQYVDLASLHVTAGRRGGGIGRQLFSRVGEWAREQGAEALYISAHSSVESQAFYRAMGCRLAQEVQSFHVQEEPFDVQMECPLA